MNNPHAVALGRLGGKAGVGKAKARTSDQARKAAFARWGTRKKHSEVTESMLYSFADLSGGPNSCWNWLRAKTIKGYPKFCYGGKLMLVTRLLMLLRTGQPVPEAHQVCHRCDNPSCINPAHLFIGTRSDNMMDCSNKGRHGNGSRTHCKHGHEFTEENTYTVKSKHGKTCRYCRLCTRISHRLARERKSRLSAPVLGGEVATDAMPQ